jgi:hypothetical protein
MNMDPIKRERDIDVDQWLESALSQYGNAEPRTGLENRVLANLQAERNRIASSRPWWWAAGAATATAVAIAMALWAGKSGHERNPANTMGASTTTQGEQRALVLSAPSPHVSHPAREIGQRMPASRSVREAVVATMPKLEQFPSRRNLSEEELLLVQRLLVQRINEQSDSEALLEATATRADADLSIDSLEIRPLQIPDIEISEGKTN